MIVNFDKLNRIVRPNMILLNPNFEELYPIGEIIYETNFKLRFNSMSEMTFTVPSLFNEREVEWFDWIESKRLVKVDNIGVFMITEVKEVNDGIQDLKEVTAYSLEVDLNYKKMNMSSGIYKFYDSLNPKNENTLIGQLLNMSQMRGWEVAYVSSDLWNKTRSYEIADQTVYNFLTVTLEENLECIVTFDTFNKTMSFYTVEEAITDTDVYLSYDNLLNEVEVEEMSDEFVTCLQVKGGGDLTIAGVNPLGGYGIYDFSYFLDNKRNWIGDSLSTKVKKWMELQKTKQPQYASTLVSIRAKNLELITIKGELTKLETEYNTIEGKLAIEIQAGGNTSTLSTQLANQKALVDAKKVQVEAKQKEVDNLIATQKSIVNQIKLTSNFTDTELKELSAYMVESTYQNDAFVQTSVMTAVEIQDMQQELYDLGVSVLNKLAQPRYTFTLSAANYLFTEKYKIFSQQTALGCQMTVDMGKGRYSYPVLLELEFSFDNPEDFTMTFGNRLRLDSDDFIYSELFDQSVNAGASVSIGKTNWNEFKNNYQTEVNQFINNELVAAQKNLVNASNQEMRFGEHGLIAQKMISDGVYSPKKAWWINNGLYFTNDNFKTVKAAFGETTNGAYGIIADILVGKLIAGNQLTIQNEDKSFSIDENGIFIKNANIIMSSGDTLENEINNSANNAKEEAIKQAGTNLADAIKDVNTSIGEMEEAIKDGMIETFYLPTSTPPTNPKLGDLWYNTTQKTLSRFDGNEWKYLEDKKALEAAQAAIDAQTTADGKIRTFYQATMPQMTPNKDIGDLWIDLSNGNKLYRWDGSSWISVRDTGFDDVSSKLEEAVTDLNQSFEDFQKAIEDGVIDIFYSSTKPTNAKTGDLWYDTINKTLNRYNGSSWVYLEDKKALEAIQAADAAQQTADGKIRTFYQDEPPKMTLDKDIGDLWIDTNDGNRLYRWDGKTWVDIRDGSIEQVSMKLEEAITGVNESFDDFKQAIEDGVIETFYQANQPSSAKIGDLWYNTTAKTLSRYNGSQWIYLEDSKALEAFEKAKGAQITADGKIRTFYQDTEPTMTQGKDIGDLWVNTKNGLNRLYRWDGYSWIDIRDKGFDDIASDLNQSMTDINKSFEDFKQSIEDGVIETYYSSTQPSNAKLGDLWYDTTNKKLSRFDGMEWKYLEDSKAEEAFKNAENAQITADGKIRTFYQDEPPVMEKNKNIGDLWIDLDDNNKLYRWSGTSWVSVQDKSIENISKNLSEVVTSVNEKISNLEQALEDGEITIWYQDTEPKEAKEGDIWYDTSNKNKAWLAKSGGTPTLVGNKSICGTFTVAKNIEWLPLEDKDVIEALEAAQSAQTTADGKIRTFYQTTEPVMENGKNIGDLWVDTDDGNKLYRWNGESWVSVQDKAIVRDNIIYNSLPNDGDNKCWGYGNGVGNYFVDSSYGSYFYLRYPTSGEVYLTSKRYLCQPNTEYTLSFDFGADGLTENGAAMFYVLESSSLTDVNEIGGGFDAASDGQWINGGSGGSAVWERKTYTFKTTGAAKSFYLRFDANGDRNSPNKGGEYRLRKIKLEANKSATTYIQSSSEDSYYAALNAQESANNALNKVNGIITSSGLIDTNKMEGLIQAGKNNIQLGTGTNRMLMNENGILITKNNGASWDTAISAYGIVADAIQSGGTINGCQAIFGSNTNNCTFINSDGEIKVMMNGCEVASLWKLPNYGGYLTIGDATGREVFRVQSAGTGSVDMNFRGYTTLSGGYSNDLTVHFGTIGFNVSDYVNIYGGLYVTGEKDAIIPTQHYGIRTLYCTEADRAYFTTDNNAETANGECIVNLDPIFMETIELNSSCPYIIHLTPYSDARVWVEQIEDDKFIVKSDKDTKFSYTLKAIRISFGNKYLEEKVNVLSKKDLQKIQEAAVMRMSEGEM